MSCRYTRLFNPSYRCSRNWILVLYGLKKVKKISKCLVEKVWAMAIKCDLRWVFAGNIEIFGIIADKMHSFIVLNKIENSLPNKRIWKFLFPSLNDRSFAFVFEHNLRFFKRAFCLKICIYDIASMMRGNRMKLCVKQLTPLSRLLMGTLFRRAWERQKDSCVLWA